MAGISDGSWRCLPRHWWLISYLSVATIAGCQGKIFYVSGTSSFAPHEWPPKLRDGEGYRGRSLEPPLRLLWQRQLDDPPLGPPVMAGALLLQLTTSPTLYAFDRHNGHRLGKKGMDEGICGGPGLAGAEGETLIIGESGRDAVLRAIDRRSRDTRWTFDGAVCAQVAVRRDTIIVPLEAGRLAALSAIDGQELWALEMTGGLAAGPLVDGDTVFAGDLKGAFIAVDVVDGGERWRAQLGASVRGTPVAHGDRIMTVSGDGVAYALDRNTGDVFWRQPIGGLLTPGVALASEMAVVGCSDRSLYGLNVEDGAIVWSFETGGAIRGVPAATAATVFAASSDGHVYGLDAQTGELRWKFRLDGPVTQSVTLGAQAMSVTTDAGSVYYFGR